MSNLQCRQIAIDELEEYDRLVDRVGTVFGQRRWLELLDGYTVYMGLFDGGNTLVGAWPLQLNRRLGLSILIRSQFTQSCGPYFSPELDVAKSGLENRRFFLSEICKFLCTKRLALCCLPLDRRIADAMVFRWANYKVVPAYTYRIPLEQTEDAIQAAFSSTRRRNIRAALRDKLRVTEINDYTIIERLSLGTYHRQNKKVAVSSMRRVLYEFSNRDNSYAFVAFRGDHAVAGVHCVYDRDSAYYLIGGYDETHAHHGAGAACMQAAILKAKELGLKLFDFEGSTVPAIERYFRGFGGELVQYLTVNRAWLPIEVLLKLKLRYLF